MLDYTILYIYIYIFFFSKNSFDKLVHLVGFIIRIYHDARSSEYIYIYIYIYICIYIYILLLKKIHFFSKTSGPVLGPLQPHVERVPGFY